jgi:hypothetical protein
VPGLGEPERLQDRDVVVTRGSGGRQLEWVVVGCVLALLLAVPIVISVTSDESGRTTVTGAGAEGSAGDDPGSVRLAAPVPDGDDGPQPQPSPTGQARAAVLAAEAAAAPNMELAVAVYDRATRESAVGDRGTEPFYTASLAKIVVAIDMLDRRRSAGLTITDEDVALLRRALGPSDDSAMNALWTKFDGQGAAARVSQRLKLTGTSAPREFGQWGEMSVPAIDFVRIWRYVLEEMPSADRDLMISAMDAAPDIARDGFNQAFGLLSPAVRGPGGPGAVAKQGWMCCFSGETYLHSSGAVGADDRYLVVLLTREPKGPGWEAARRGLDDVADAAVRALG